MLKKIKHDRESDFEVLHAQSTVISFINKMTKSIVLVIDPNSATNNMDFASILLQTHVIVVLSEKYKIVAR